MPGDREIGQLESKIEKGVSGNSRRIQILDFFPILYFHDFC